MAGNEDNHSTGSKEYMNKMEEVMNMWSHIMHDLYLKFTPLLITLSVAAIGFAASYILDGQYYSGQYETTLGYIVISCLFAGSILLIVSCCCGLTHLGRNAEFAQCTMSYFKERYRVATNRYYEKTAETHANENENTSGCKNPSPLWWRCQILLFGVGISLLVFWVGLDFFYHWTIRQSDFQHIPD